MPSLSGGKSAIFWTSQFLRGFLQVMHLKMNPIASWVDSALIDNVAQGGKYHPEMIRGSLHVPSVIYVHVLHLSIGHPHQQRDLASSHDCLFGSWCMKHEFAAAQIEWWCFCSVWVPPLCMVSCNDAASCRIFWTVLEETCSVSETTYRTIKSPPGRKVLKAVRSKAAVIDGGGEHSHLCANFFILFSVH